MRPDVKLMCITNLRNIGNPGSSLQMLYCIHPVGVRLFHHSWLGLVPACSWHTEYLTLIMSTYDDRVRMDPQEYPKRWASLTPGLRYNNVLRKPKVQEKLVYIKVSLQSVATNQNQTHCNRVWSNMWNLQETIYTIYTISRKKQWCKETRLSSSMARLTSSCNKGISLCMLLSFACLVRRDKDLCVRTVPMCNATKDYGAK